MATDVSERALALHAPERRAQRASTNIETRQGDFLEPVRGERFGIAVCNAPYVIAPETGMVYRDSPLRGDALSRRLLEDLPDVLQDGGFGVLQGNWAHAAGAPWHPRGAVHGAAGPDPDLRRRASTRIAWTRGRPSRATPRASWPPWQRWTAEYRELGIEAITSAMVVLQRRLVPAPLGDHHPRRGPQGLGRRLPGLFAADERLDGLQPRKRAAPRARAGRSSAPRRRARCTLEHPATPSVRFDGHARRGRCGGRAPRDAPTPRCGAR